MHTQAHTGSQLKFFETEAAEACEGCWGQESEPCVIGCAAGPLCEILPGSLKRKPQIAQLNEIYSKKQCHSELPVQVGMRPWQSSGGCKALAHGVDFGLCAREGRPGAFTAPGDLWRRGRRSTPVHQARARCREGASFRERAASVK